MNLYTDDNPITTLQGLGFKDKKKAIHTIKTVEKYFDELKKKQKIPGYTPKNVLPKIKITNKKQCVDYYNKQKMYRILGMLNRAKGMIKRVQNTDNIKEAILVFEKWMNNYKQQNGGKIISCCDNIDNKKKCMRPSDGKIFDLPRKYSRIKCEEGVRGFTMRSSCAPFKNC